MPTLEKYQVCQLAHIAGIDLDEQRAELVTARLGAVLNALAEIPADALAAVEPATTFAPLAPKDASPQEAADE